MPLSLTQTQAWQDLARHGETLRSQKLPEIVLADATRLERFQIELDGLRYIYALNHLTQETLSLLVKLAEQQHFAAWRDRMFRGEKINNTEDRAVLHVALRGTQTAADPLFAKAVQDVLRRMEGFVESVRGGQWRGATGKPIRHVVNIGIGGSDLGPRLVTKALSAYASGPTIHYVTNVDAFDILSVLAQLDPEETLFTVVSKTFTTQETLLNAKTARRWIVDRLGEAAVAKHFVAVSVNQQEVEKFGIAPAHMFPLWDWVGGRYSLWSAVGLSIALSIGMKNFRALLDGAAIMDRHFLSAPLALNMPVILGLIGIWNRNFLQKQTLAVLPYAERLRDLPRFLQQLDMESNGKSVTREGRRVDYATSPVVFGECGTVGQHSFHQCLHQGTDTSPVDFIGIRQDDLGMPEHRQSLHANMIAQASSFVFGQPDAAIPQEVYEGGRTSNILLLDALDPKRLGMLLALYEHKVFVQGVVWGLNSFDQPGVELGKQLARHLATGMSLTGPAGGFMQRLQQNTV